MIFGKLSNLKKQKPPLKSHTELCADYACILQEISYLTRVGDNACQCLRQHKHDDPARAITADDIERIQKFFHEISRKFEKSNLDPK